MECQRIIILITHKEQKKTNRSIPETSLDLSEPLNLVDVSIQPTPLKLLAYHDYDISNLFRGPTTTCQTLQFRTLSKTVSIVKTQRPTIFGMKTSIYYIYPMQNELDFHS